MSDADIKANIGVSTDVEQATKKTSNAVVSMGKQIEDVQKKFSTAGKDIFLGFFAPMAILQGAISMISDSIAKAKQDAKDGLELLAKGETIYATSEEKKMAAFFKAKKLREDEQAQAKAGKEEIARQFLKSDEGWKIGKQVQKETSDIFGNPTVSMTAMEKNPEFQKRALKAFLESPEGKAYQPIFGDKKDFKAPEGFSNVVGVGSNPVLETMTRQTEIQEEILEHLKNSMPSSGQTDIDFTKVNPNLTTTA